MKKKLLLPLLLAGGLCSTPAFAETYVSGSVGLGMMSNAEVSYATTTIKDAAEFKSGIPFGIAFGNKFGEYRVEGAISHQSNDVEMSKLTTSNFGVSTPVVATKVSLLSFMVNGYRDFAIKDPNVSPYLMAGLGFVQAEETEYGVTTIDETVFAWQLGAGVGIKVADKVAIDLSARYFSPSEVSDITDTVNFSVSSMNVLAGVRYTF